MKRKYLKFLVCIALLLSPYFALAQSSGYEYSPTFKAEPDSAGLTIGVSNVEHEPNFKVIEDMDKYWSSSSEMINLDQAISGDLLEILSAKGISVRGPFKSNKIPKAEKKVIDFLLVPKVQILASAEPVYRLKDVRVDVKGTFTLELKDPAKFETFWSTNVPFTVIKIEEPSFPWKKIGRIVWADPNTVNTINDEKILKSIEQVQLSHGSAEDVAKGIKKQYPDLMDALAKVINPEEMKSLKNQIANQTIPSVESTKENQVQKTIEPYVPSFSYTPTASRSPAAQGISFAVAKPSPVVSDIADKLWMTELAHLKKIDSASGKFLWYTFAQFTNVGTKMRRDIAETLFAKGFAMQGPYEYYESIPAADKQKIDFYIVPKIELNFATRNVKKLSLLVTHVEVGGTITLEIRGMKNFDLLSTKTLPLVKFEVVSETDESYSVEQKFNLIMNDVVKGVEKQYPSLIKGISALIDPQEMRLFKKGSAGKTGY